MEKRMAEWEARNPEFWTGMLRHLHERQYDVTRQRAKSISRRWMDFNFGIGGMNLYLGLKPDLIQVGLNLDDTKTRSSHETFSALKKQKLQIEQSFGSDLDTLIWEVRTSKRCSIRCDRHVDFANSSGIEWPEFYDWMERHLGRFQTVFLPLMRNM